MAVELDEVWNHLYGPSKTAKEKAWLHILKCQAF